MKFTAFTPAAAFAVLLLMAAPANALTLEENDFEKGEVELQYEATYTDKNAEGSYEHEEEIEVQMGITDWLRLTVGIEYEEEEDEMSFRFSELEGEVQLKFLDPTKDIIGLGLFAGVSKEIESDEKSFAVGLITDKHINNWTLRGNLFYISDIDSDSDEKYDGVEYRYQIRYNVNKMVGLGVEGYGMNQDFDDSNEDDLTTHMIGPVLYYSFERANDKVRHASIKDVSKSGADGDDDEEGTEFELQAGVLFGTTDYTADVTFKWGLEIDF